jgi:hypothetical protein
MLGEVRLCVYPSAGTISMHLPSVVVGSRCSRALYRHTGSFDALPSFLLLYRYMVSGATTATSTPDVRSIQPICPAVAVRCIRPRTAVAGWVIGLEPTIASSHGDVAREGGTRRSETPLQPPASQP